MRQLPEGLQAHLNTGGTTMCHCWHIMTRDGLSLGFTDHDETLSFEGIEFEPQSGFTGTTIETSLGMAVDTQDVSGALQSAALSEADLAAGVFDNAEVHIWLVNWVDTEQRVLLRKGNLGEVTRGPLAFQAEVRGLAHKLNQRQGRLFQYACDAELGDARCTKDISDPDFSATAQIIEVRSDRQIVVSGLDGYLQGWFELGTVTFDSGANLGRLVRIRSHVAQVSTVSLELESKPAWPLEVGTVMTVKAGCDKRFETCRAKFSNAINFRGFPHMPGNDFVTYYPSSTDTGNDGSSRN